MTRTAQIATAVDFSGVVELVGSTALIRLPKTASEQLPSRGQVAARVAVHGREFSTVLEPDGVRGHWLRLEQPLDAGDTVDIALEVSTQWPEPEVPADLADELAAAPATIREMWSDITPMARWEWVRWVNATANPATRRRRVEVTIDKMANGKRRPCCFDLSACTDPAVSRSGKLVGSA